MDAARLRKLAMSFPGATETVQWENDLVFKVGGKMFAVTGLEEDSRYSFKVADDRFLELSDLPGFKPAPYLARAKWVQVDPSACDLPSEHLEDLIREAYEIIFGRLTKKLQREIQPD